MATAKLASWASARWIDQALTAEWLIDSSEAIGMSDDQVQQMMDLIPMLHDQGADWDGWFETFQGGAGGHNVNNAQGLKSSAVWFRYSGNQTMRQLSRERLEALDAKYGLPTGMF